MDPDYCPLYVKSEDGAKAATKWQFNGWAKYSDWQNDDKAGERAARFSKVPMVQPGWNGTRVVLEGGSIDVNGAGLMLTTKSVCSVTSRRAIRASTGSNSKRSLRATSACRR